MKKFFAVLFVVFTFLIVFYPVISRDKYRVLDVLGNDSLYIDFNKNLEIDDNELVKINGVKTFPVKYSPDIKNLSEKFNLSENEIRTLGFLAQKYLIENLKGKYVEIKNLKDGSGDVFLNGTNAAFLLIRSDLAYLKDREYTPSRAKRFKNIEYFVFDTKKEILHKADCPDTKDIHDFILLKKADLENNIKTCPRCMKHLTAPVEQVQNKKFSYPASKTKGNFTLYLLNPYNYTKPSNVSRTEVCRFLIRQINNSNRSIYFSIYGVDNQNEVINALVNAKKRNLDVIGVSDSDEKGNPTYSDMFKFKNIKITYDNKKSIMHDKFFVFDNKIVLTGSMNISKTGCGGYNSNSVAVIRNGALANAYKNEFAQMAKGIFKNLKKDFSISNVKVNPDTIVSAYFSPVNDLYKSAFQKEIRNAKKNIRMSVFILTYDNIANDLIAAAKRGVNVRVIVDATGAMGHKRLVKKMRENNIKVKVENWGGKNHEKTMTIDDNTMIMGSANFTYAAITKNDENLLVIKDRDIVKFYNGFFDLLYDSIPNIYLNRFVRAEGFDSINSCHDGIDNNFDGNVDLFDVGCKVKR